MTNSGNWTGSTASWRATPEAKPDRPDLYPCLESRFQLTATSPLDKHGNPYYYSTYMRSNGGKTVSRDLAAEIDSLRDEVRSLATTVRSLTEGGRIARSGLSPAAQSALDREDESIRVAAKELVGEARARGVAGIVRYSGYYASSGEEGRGESLWVDEERTSDELLAQGHERVAKVLAALGNAQRLAILGAILERPASAAELVERLGMGTTGQVYHHLNALQAADLVSQSGRGRFEFRFGKVPAFLTLLAGAHDMLREARDGSGIREGDIEREEG